MNPTTYHRFLAELIVWVGATPDVVGLVGVGSTGGQTRSPDRWSDHDLVVVAAAGRAVFLRDDPAWLPEAPGRAAVR